MKTDQRAYTPGEAVKVRWQRGDVRGVAYSLDVWTGTGWKTRFFVSAVTREQLVEQSPVWWDVSERGVGWNDVGIAGRGPDIAVVPDTAAPGTYRLCTANSPQLSCAVIAVEEAP